MSTKDETADENATRERLEPEEKTLEVTHGTDDMGDYVCVWVDGTGYLFYDATKAKMFALRIKDAVDDQFDDGGEN